MIYPTTHKFVEIFHQKLVENWNPLDCGNRWFGHWEMMEVGYPEITLLVIFRLRELPSPKKNQKNIRFRNYPNRIPMGLIYLPTFSWLIFMVHYVGIKYTIYIYIWMVWVIEKIVQISGKRLVFFSSFGDPKPLHQSHTSWGSIFFRSFENMSIKQESSPQEVWSLDVYRGC